ncbi:MAG: PKD domain-containing protein [Bacteroidetes bacterium]|nr:PKD domain-containing protein [Bacteroidota bacterium]
MKTITTKFIQISLIIAAIAAFTGCSKEPDACFYFPKGKIVTGEEIRFTNCSVDAQTSVWNFGDGTTSRDPSPEHSYTLHSYTLPGEYTITLTVYSKGDLKTDETSETITIEGSLYDKLAGFWNWDAIKTVTYFYGNSDTLYQQKTDESIDFINETSAVIDTSGSPDTTYWSAITNSYSTDRIQLGAKTWYIYFEDSLGVPSDKAFVLKNLTTAPWNGSMEQWYFSRD